MDRWEPCNSTDCHRKTKFQNWLRHSKRLSFSWRTWNWITIYTSVENLGWKWNRCQYLDFGTPGLNDLHEVIEWIIVSSALVCVYDRRLSQRSLWMSARGSRTGNALTLRVQTSSLFSPPLIRLTTSKRKTASIYMLWWFAHPHISSDCKNRTAEYRGEYRLLQCN